jgi:hypothetical protein
LREKYPNKMKSIAILAAVSTTVAAHDFKSCPGAKGNLHVNTVTLNPDPPALGKNIEVSFAGGPTTVDISGGKASLAILLHGVKLTTADFDFCSDLGVTCPLTKGSSFVASANYKLPYAPLPPGLKIEVDATFDDTSGDELDCYTLQTGLASGSTLLQVPGVFNGTLAEDDARQIFSAWKKQFPHVSLDDEEMRYKIWKTNLETIIDHNENNNDSDYKMGMNEFGHLTWREFKKMYVGAGIRPDLSTSDVPRKKHVVPENFAANATRGVDWAKKGAVTPIKNQGQCGSW